MVDSAAKGPAKRRRGRTGQEKSPPKAAGHGQDPATRGGGGGAPPKLLVALTEEEPTWYQCGRRQPERDATAATHPPPPGPPRRGAVTPELVAKYRQAGDRLYQEEIAAFGRTSSANRSSDDRWVEGTMKKGTLKDRIAAMSVVVSTDPVHKLYALDGLLQMAGCSESGSQQTNSRIVQLAAESLEDLFLNTLLPPDRKLLTLAHRPLYLYEQVESAKKKQTAKTLSPRILLLWRFEELVKEKYQRFLRQCLEKTLRDSMEMDKIFALRLAASLLSSAPEGEAVLLQLIVNKLGDPSKKVAAAAARELRKILQKHPAMQLVVAREVQQLAFRPGLKSRALYHSITFLNQLKLRREDSDSDKIGKSSLPVSLIGSYFRLFDVVIKKQLEAKDDQEGSEMKSRLLSALLSGVNRAHPYLPEKDKNMDEHVDALYRVVHTAPPVACTQSLQLLFHVVIGSGSAATDENNDDVKNETDSKRQDRFYRALYSTLSRREMLCSGKHLTMLFNLLYKAMKYDTDSTRVVAFAKRILCTTMHYSAPVVAASIFLLNAVSQRHPVILDCFRDRLQDPDSRRVLDPTKREPTGAIVVDGIQDGDRAVKKAPLWEFALTRYHFHPSVVKFSESLGEIGYDGDPLRDFSLPQFLDKFAYRNPKSAERVANKFKRGESVGERRSGSDKIIQSQLVPPVNDPSFLQRQRVEVHDEFFLRFFVERAKRDHLKGIQRYKGSEDKDEEDEEERAIQDEEVFDMGRSFDDYEREWESDSDEEAFVDSLAQQIIEDSIDNHGPDELDDEDPDMDDWDDMYDSDEKHDTRAGEDDASNLDGNSDENDDDDDKFMEDTDNDDDDDEAPELLDLGEGESFGDDEYASDDGSVEADRILLNNESEESDDNNDSAKKKFKDLPTYADAEDYEAMINESLSKHKRPRSNGNHDKEDADLQSQIPENKRKRKTNKS